MVKQLELRGTFFQLRQGFGIPESDEFFPSCTSTGLTHLTSEVDRMIAIKTTLFPILILLTCQVCNGQAVINDEMDLYVNDEIEIRYNSGDELDALADFSIVNNSAARRVYVVKMVIFSANEGMEGESEIPSNVVGNGIKLVTLDPGESHNDGNWDSIELAVPLEVPSNPPLRYGVKVTIEVLGSQAATPVTDFFIRSDFIPDVPGGLFDEF